MNYLINGFKIEDEKHILALYVCDGAGIITKIGQLLGSKYL